VKAPYEFGNDPMKIMCFEHGIRTKFDDRIMMLKLCIIVFFSHNCNGTFFLMSFLCLDMHILFFFFIVVCIHFRCYPTSDVHPIMCVLYEKKQLEISVKQGYNILFNVLLMYFFG